MFTEVAHKQVKSAKRIIEILEYFSQERQEATITDIVRDLGYPQSSASELLHCLESLGYLSVDSHRRSFRPTARLALLGARVSPSFFHEGKLLRVMDGLSHATGELIFLAAVVGLSVRYIHVIQPPDASRAVVPPGASRPLLHTAVGRLLLSTRSDRDIEKIALRLNAGADAPWKVSLAELKTELSKIRQLGFSLSLNTSTAGGGAIAVLLPDSDPNCPLALGIGGTRNIVGENQTRYLELLREAAQQCGPQPRPWPHEDPDGIQPDSLPIYRYERPESDSALPDWSCKSSAGKDPAQKSST